jgi:hypothetical protein
MPDSAKRLTSAFPNPGPAPTMTATSLTLTSSFDVQFAIHALDFTYRTKPFTSSGTSLPIAPLE